MGNQNNSHNSGDPLERDLDNLIRIAQENILAVAETAFDATFHYMTELFVPSAISWFMIRENPHLVGKTIKEGSVRACVQTIINRMPPRFRTMMQKHTDDVVKAVMYAVDVDFGMKIPYKEIPTRHELIQFIKNNPTESESRLKEEGTVISLSTLMRNALSRRRGEKYQRDREEAFLRERAEKQREKETFEQALLSIGQTQEQVAEAWIKHLKKRSDQKLAKDEEAIQAILPFVQKAMDSQGNILVTVEFTKLKTLFKEKKIVDFDKL